MRPGQNGASDTPVACRRTAPCTPTTQDLARADLLDGHVAREDDQVRPRQRGAELVLDGLQQRQRLVETRVLRPRIFRREADARAVAPPVVIRGAEGARALQRQCGERGAVVRPPFRRYVGRQDVGVVRLQQGLYMRPHLREVHHLAGGRQRVLERLGRGHEVARATRVGTHVVRHELVPGVRERVGEGGQVTGVVSHQLHVAGVVEEAHVAGHHHDVLLAISEGRGRRGRGLLRFPLEVPAGPRVYTPREALQIREVLRVKVQRIRRPWPLKARGEGAVVAEARPGVEGVLRGGGSGAIRARAVRLAERMPTADERHRLRVVHPHAPERAAYLMACLVRQRVAVGALRVDVDEPDLRSAERGAAVARSGAGKQHLLLGRGAQQL